MPAPPQAHRLFLALALALSLRGAGAIPQLSRHGVWREERPSVDDEITAVPGFKVVCLCVRAAFHMLGNAR